MTIKDAERFYKIYNGYTFQMGREEPAKYDAFRELKIPDDMLREWDLDLIAQGFEHLWDEEKNVWSRQGDLLEVIKRFGKGAGVYVDPLLQEMEKMDRLNKQNRILIIENMSGRDREYKSGGVYFICTNTDQAEHMNEVMKKIMDFTCTDKDNLEYPGWTDINGRFTAAKNAYKRALKKYSTL